MGNNMMQIHPQHMAQIQALQARQMAARQVGLAPYPCFAHANPELQAQNPQQAVRCIFPCRLS